MNKNEDIISKLDRRDGINVPNDYFADFAERLTAMLPERSEIEAPDKILSIPQTNWQRVRPYVYMAAMFAGVWCMLKLFSLINAPADPLSIESYPELAGALDNDQIFHEIVVEDLNQWDLVDDMMEDGADIGELLYIDSLNSYDVADFDANVRTVDPTKPHHLLPDQALKEI